MHALMREDVGRSRPPAPRTLSNLYTISYAITPNLVDGVDNLLDADREVLKDFANELNPRLQEFMAVGWLWGVNSVNMDYPQDAHVRLVVSRSLELLKEYEQARKEGKGPNDQQATEQAQDGGPGPMVPEVSKVTRQFGANETHTVMVAAAAKQPTAPLLSPQQPAIVDASRCGKFLC